jgi:hypothetical protein
VVVFPHSTVSDGLELDPPGQIVSGHSSDWTSTGAKAAENNVPGMGIGAGVGMGVGIGRGAGVGTEVAVGTGVGEGVGTEVGSGTDVGVFFG